MWQHPLFTSQPQRTSRMLWVLAPILWETRLMVGLLQLQVAHAHAQNHMRLQDIRI